MSARKAAATVTGVLGELFITAGVVLGLFVAWQLWWTDVVAERAQDAMIAELVWAAPLPPVPVEVPDDGIAEAQDGEPPAVPGPGPFETFATMIVPRFGDDYQRTISEGVTRSGTLDELGIGWYPHSALPGEVGNFALAGHRMTFGKPFNLIAELVEGDPVIVQTPDVWFVYRVTESYVVLPHQVEVVAPVPGDRDAEPTERFITLTSCHPMFSAAERYIVHGELDYWAWTADGVPVELAGGS